MSPSKPYIAGFFDGEGSIGIYSRKDRKGGYHLRTQLTQNLTPKSLELIEFLQSVYGGNFSPHKTLSMNTNFNWQLNGDKAVVFLEDILPFLVLKEEQALLAIEFQKNRPTINRNRNGEIQAHSMYAVKWCKDISDKMKKLKGR